MSYQIYNEEDFFESKFLVNNTVKLTIIKLHEYAHTKFKGDYQLKISPRYLLIDNLDYLDNKKKVENENKIEVPELGQAKDNYIFGDELIVNNIIYSKGKDLSQLYKSDLFTKNNFNDLNKITENFKPNNIKKFSDKNVLVDIKKYGKSKLLTYYDLNISSTDLI